MRRFVLVAAALVVLIVALCVAVVASRSFRSGTALAGVPTVPPTATATIPASLSPTPTPLTPTPTPTIGATATPDCIFGIFPCVTATPRPLFSPTLTPSPAVTFGPSPPDNTDTDADGVIDVNDNCVYTANAAQTNTDALPFVQQGLPTDITNPNADFIGDACDPDRDNDGLPNFVEAFAAPCPSASGPTDPLKADTDGDRFLDGAECALGTDPANPASKPATPSPANDPDHDLLSTAFELTIGSDPNKSDTDGDGMTDGIEVLRYNTSPINQNTDADNCNDGREVATVNNDFVVSSSDLGIVAAHFSSGGGPLYVSDYDMNRDGVISASDLGFVASHFGACP